MKNLKYQRNISLVLAVMLMLMCVLSINNLGIYGVKAEDVTTEEAKKAVGDREKETTEEATTEEATKEDAAEPYRGSESLEQKGEEEETSIQNQEKVSQKEEAQEEISAYAMPSTGEVVLYKYASKTKIPYIKTWDIHNTKADPHYSFFMLIKKGGKKYVSYCLDYGLKSTNYTGITSTNLNKVGKEEAKMLRAAMTFGYNKPVTEANLTKKVKAKFGATQAMIYCIRAGIVGKASMKTTAKKYLSAYEDNATATSFFNTLSEKVTNYTKIPGFTSATEATAPTHKLEWNEDRKRYEKRVTLEQALVNACDFTNSQGITFEGNGTSLIMYSKNPIPVRRILSGKRSDLGVRSSAVFYWNTKKTYQKLASVDLASVLAYTEFYYAVQTELPTMIVEKQDAETKAVVPDTTFQVKAAEDIKTPDGVVQVKKDTVVQKVTTGTNGRATTMPLYPGNYEVEETKPAEGYSIGTESCSVALHHQTQVTDVVVMENEPTKIKLVKVSKGTEERMPGITFELRKKSETISDASEEKPAEPEVEAKEYTTDDNGEILISYLPVGTYQIREIKTQPGYVLDETVYEIVVDEHGLIEGKSEKEIIISNDYTKIQVEKNDFVTGEPVKGATLVILDAKEHEIAQWKTDGTPHYMEKLEPGEYVLREITAPEGYEKAEEVSFVVEPTGEIQVVKMLDKPIPKEEKPEEETPKKKRKEVKTGDVLEEIMVSCLALLVISGGTMLHMIYRRRKNS